MKDEKILYHSTKGLLPHQVVDTMYNKRLSRVLYSENRVAAESGLALDNNKELLFDYNQRFMEIISGVLPKSILLIGGGAFTLPKAINERFPNLSLDVVELDSELYQISKKYFGFKPNNKTRIYIQDGNEYIESTNKHYDLIIVDVFLNNIIPPSFQSEKFTKSLKTILTKDGIVAMNIIANYHGRISNSMLPVLSSFKSSFVNIQLFPAGNESSLWLPQNFIITAQNQSREIESFLRFKSLKLPTMIWPEWITKLRR